MSLYLKYRPLDFASLVGQNFTKETLQKAISENKTVGAYLFCGPRGTGKTSTARIFAKSINCLSQIDGNPCGTCKVCVDFSEEKLLDIIEIDAASHTGVDNIREIIERAQFAPNFCKYKVYIIDEVHMLSKGAFNALLKILEEPPKHVKFILATTETHKLPDTIISRCQRYDFKRISASDIEARLLFIAKEESVEIDKQSLEYIIKNSGGGLRNAISLFEQLIENNTIDYQKIIEKLGIVNEEIFENFLEKLLSYDESIIQDFDQLIADGKNIKLFFKEFIFFTKNKALIELKNKENISKYIYILEQLDETYGKTKISLDENTTFLIGILKIISQYSGNTSKQIKTDNNLGRQEKNVKEQKEEPQIKKEEQQEENNNISETDALDIFHTDKNVKIGEKSSSSIDFSTITFISELKKIGAKGALTMALRGSGLELIGNTLIIKTKTKIAAGQVGNQDNIGLMIQALENIGIENPEIKQN